MTNPTIAVAALTKPVLARYMGDLIALERLIVAELGTLYDEQPWGVPEFEMDLPGKWDYSWCATDTGTEAAVGFLVISRFGDNLHGHRMVVHPDYRRLGIAGQFYDQLFAKAKAAGLGYYTAQVPYDNHATRDWYLKRGHDLLTDLDLGWYIEARGIAGEPAGDHLASNGGRFWILRYAIGSFTAPG